MKTKTKSQTKEKKQKKNKTNKKNKYTRKHLKTTKQRNKTTNPKPKESISQQQFNFLVKFSVTSYLSLYL